MSSKHTKRALLSSVLSLVLCFSMLLGATFAWFTDTATTSVNTIQAGTLDVALEMKNGDNWVSAEGQTLNFLKAAGAPAGEAILWEPGCTYSLPELRIINNGNLALKYKVVLAGIQGDAELNNVIDWTITLGELVPAADGVATHAETDLGADHNLLPNQSQTLTISGHMQESAGNEYQGKSIDGIAITVYATQLDAEYDSFDNDYDENAEYDVLDTWTGTTEGGTQTEPTQGEQAAFNEEDGNYHITSAAEFINYIKGTTAHSPSATNRWDSKPVVLDKSIDLNGYEFVLTGETYAFSGQFDGKGHTVSNFKITRTDGNLYTGLFGYLYDANTSVKNLTVKNAVVSSSGGEEAGQVAAIVPSVSNGIVDNCHAINCTVSGQKKVGAVVGYAQGGTVSNCSAKDCAVAVVRNNAAEVTLFGFVNGATFTNNRDKGGNTLLYGNTTGVEAVASGVVKAGSTYYISSAAGLNWFNDQINKSHNSFDGKTIKLAADINYNNGTWLPAGQNYTTADYPAIGYANTVEFHGTFDGQNHTISNIKIGMTAVAVNSLDDTLGSTTDHEISSVGFFGYTCGTVKNLTLDNATVTGFHNVGGIVGYTDSTSYIENCHVKNSSISCTHFTDDQCGDKAGGIVGYLNNNVTGDDIKNCSVSNTTITAGRDAGQVIGCLSTGATHSGCTATSVTLTADTGCTHTSHGANMAGGIVGRNLNAG